ncbi:hypothetical protein ACLMAJ_10950 [Nocardia sp. KC 131]
MTTGRVARLLGVSDAATQPHKGQPDPAVAEMARKITAAVG